MKTIKCILIMVLSHTFLCAQNKYNIEIGLGIPDNSCSKYLKLGYYINYGIDFSLNQNFILNPSVCANFNTRNPNYQYGFEDELKFRNNPDAVEAYKQMALDTKYVLYLFNPALELDLKYKILCNKMLSPFFFIGISASYSLYTNPTQYFEFDADTNLISMNGGDEVQLQKFNIGYKAGAGITYTLKSGKSIYLETHYKLLPNLKFGRNSDRVGLLNIGFGISSPFRKKDKDNDADIQEDIE